MNILAVLAGGGAGAVCRYLLSKVLSEHSSNYIPAGTVAVNLMGAFIIGFLFEAFSAYEVRPLVRLLLTTGFLGGFTTFSTYALEAVQLFRAQQYFRGILYIALHDVLGLVIVVLGMLAFIGLKNLMQGGFHA